MSWDASASSLSSPSRMGGVGRVGRGYHPDRVAHARVTCDAIHGRKAWKLGDAFSSRFAGVLSRYAPHQSRYFLTRLWAVHSSHTRVLGWFFLGFQHPKAGAQRHIRTRADTEVLRVPPRVGCSDLPPTRAHPRAATPPARSPRAGAVDEPSALPSSRSSRRVRYASRSRARSPAPASRGFTRRYPTEATRYTRPSTPPTPRVRPRP